MLFSCFIFIKCPNNAPHKHRRMTLENGTVGGSASAENKDHTIKQPPQRFQIPRDILDDLASRFIINVPVEERSDLIRICFQIELAHWFYLDFYCGGDKDEKLVEVNIKYFALHIFKVCFVILANIVKRQYVNDLFLVCFGVDSISRSSRNICRDWRQSSTSSNSTRCRCQRTAPS